MRALALLLLLPAAGALACEGLQVESGWIRPPAPGMTMTAGYARLANRGAQALTIDRVSSSAFAEVEMHRTLVEGGLSRMRPALPLTLAPGATQALAPGGYHLMLFNPAGPLASGDPVLVQFHCGAQARQAPFTLRPEAP